MDWRALPPLFVAYHANLAKGRELTHNDLRSRWGRGDGQVLLGIKRWAELAQQARDLIVAGRYVFTPEIFECIDETGRGVGGEIQLTDAMNLLAQRQSMYALAWQAKRYDIGNRVEYAKCFIDFALRRPETAKAVREHLRALLEET